MAPRKTSRSRGSSFAVSPTPAKRVWWLVYLFVCMSLVFIVVISGRSAGRWLVREDPLTSADVIVVLSGSMPYRAEEAGKLSNMGKAPEVWVSRPENPAAELQKFDIHFIGEEEYSREILLRQGVRISAPYFPDPIVNTEREVNEVAREMRKTGKRRPLL